MKTILHITHTDIKTDSRILKEMESLVKASYQVYGLGIELEEGAAETKFTFGVDIYSIKLFSRKLTFLQRSIRHLLSLCEIFFKMLPIALKLRPYAVHCHDTLVLPVGVMIKLLTGARLVYDAHELESNRNGLTKLQGRLTFLVERLSWRFINSLIVVSPSIQKWYFDNIGIKPSAVIMNAPLFEPPPVIDKEYLRHKFNIPLDCMIFIYIGILGKGRGIELVTSAFSSPNIRSHVVFLGFGELTYLINEMAERTGKFHLHPAVPHAQVVPIAMSADFGLCLIENVSLSDYLCLPNKLFEYCFSGIPVLASNFPEIKNIIDEYGIGDCCNLDVTDIIRAVKRIESEPIIYPFNDVSKLTWQEQGRNLLNLYQHLT